VAERKIQQHYENHLSSHHQETDNENWDGSQNSGSFTFQSPDMANSPRQFHSILGASTCEQQLNYWYDRHKRETEREDIRELHKVTETVLRSVLLASVFAMNEWMNESINQLTD
jgi:hypothetical protein